MNHVATPLKHSGLGIASTIIAIVGGLCLVAVFVYAGIASVGEPGGQMSENDPRAMMIGLGAIAALGLLCLGGILGLAGLFVGERKRVFAWVGLVLNALPVLGGVALIGLGLAMTN